MLVFRQVVLLFFCLQNFCFAKAMILDRNSVDSDDLWSLVSAKFSMPGLDNKYVRHEFEKLCKDPYHYNIVFDRSKPFLYFITRELYNYPLMPGEFAFIPVVESAFDSTAEAKKEEAVGLWQLRHKAAAVSGLVINEWYDARLSIIDSTEAALSYLDYLQNAFDGDSLLALAAYNAGESRVRKALSRAGGVHKDVFKLDIPEQTKFYIAKIYAFSHLFANSNKMNIILPKLSKKPLLYTIEVKESIDFNAIANVADISVGEIIKYNPCFLKRATEPNTLSRLLLSKDSCKKLSNFLLQYKGKFNKIGLKYTVKPGDDISIISEKFMLNKHFVRKINKNNKLKAGSIIELPNALSMFHGEQEYIIKKGDTLWSIAKIFNTSVDFLVERNDLQNIKFLKPGQLIYVPVM